METHSSVFETLKSNTSVVWMPRLYFLTNCPPYFPSVTYSVNAKMVTIMFYYHSRSVRSRSRSERIICQMVNSYQGTKTSISNGCASYTENTFQEGEVTACVFHQSSVLTPNSVVKAFTFIPFSIYRSAFSGRSQSGSRTVGHSQSQYSPALFNLQWAAARRSFSQLCSTPVTWFLPQPTKTAAIFISGGCSKSCDKVIVVIHTQQWKHILDGLTTLSIAWSFLACMYFGLNLNFFFIFPQSDNDMYVFCSLVFVKCNFPLPGNNQAKE